MTNKKGQIFGREFSNKDEIIDINDILQIEITKKRGILFIDQECVKKGDTFGIYGKIQIEITHVKGIVLGRNCENKFQGELIGINYRLQVEITRKK